ncbi:hypothetical protein DC366_03620 [Pelagivirga sediminicola]|uniref:Diguanylate cyclase n=1 Tax=Pelagivirga sediminicola TaxID=2170575 RepID=A0A2T7G909_9RHOB|nr:EAL domain-containing protein [Pelagivirga sediminicola]PVA10891.1 hypothetical protein DC366_03620 [Pelagivirga sediminicola]
MTQWQTRRDDGRAGECAGGRGAASLSGGPSAATDAVLPRLILDHARDGIALLDIRGRVLWMNPALERMLGWPLDLMRGRNPAEFINLPENRPGPAELAKFRYLPGSSLFQQFRVTRHMRRDGTRFWNQQSHALIDTGRQDAQKMVVVTCRDITDQVRVQTALERMKDDLEHAAYHDDLTGLGNRKKLSQYLGSAPVRASIGTGRVGVLQLDLDKFKQINDTLGHAAGDAVLRHIARALGATAQQGDLVCRTGGDEFLLICCDVGSKAALMSRAKAILRASRAPLAWKDQTITPGISIGASLCRGTPPTPETCGGEALIAQADQALYAAKEEGRGRAFFYTPELGARYRAERQLARDLATAIEQGQFIVHLQPILHLRSGRVTGCEALLRWQHPTRGLLAPPEFLGAAAQAQLLPQIDYLAMNASLDALVSLRDQGFDDLCLSLNVSSAILADADYPALLNWAMQSRGLPPGCISIEILETSFMNRGAPDGCDAIARLRRLGARVALDDFGTGHAGLAHLSTVELDAIKLDRSMVGRLETDGRTRVIARAIIRLCRMLGMEVVAEGVETQAQIDILGRARCPLVQGYGVARPMPLAELPQWLLENKAFSLPVTLPPRDEPSPAAPPAGRARRRGDNSI